MTTTSNSNTPAASANLTPKPATQSVYEGPNPTNAPIVKMRLLQKDTMQYDYVNKILLNSDAKEGVPIPLTPFFAGRIGITLELVI